MTYDNKHRKLLTGEFQKKNGLYCYKYQENGITKAVYSWKLVEKDKVPIGKKDCLSLREKERQIKRFLESGVHTNGSNYNVL